MSMTNNNNNNNDDWQTAKKKRNFSNQKSNQEQVSTTTTTTSNNMTNTTDNVAQNDNTTSTLITHNSQQQHSHHQHQHHHHHHHRPTELCTPFSFWFYRKEKGITDYEKNMRKIGDFHTVEGFWGFYTHLIRPDEMPVPSDYHLFRQNIRPVWEDPENQLGGKWLIRTKKAFTPRLWEDLVLAFVGGQFSDEVTGLVLSIREYDALSVWTRNSKDDRLKQVVRNVMKRVLDLPPGTKMEFKAHNAALAPAVPPPSTTTGGGSYRNPDVYIVPYANPAALTTTSTTTTASSSNYMSSNNVFATAALSTNNGGGSISGDARSTHTAQTGADFPFVSASYSSGVMMMDSNNLFGSSHSFASHGNGPFGSAQQDGQNTRL